MAERIVLLPVGSVEEHGRLPADTDTLVARAFCELVRGRMEATVEAPMDEGFCPTTCAFARTQVLRFEEVFHGVGSRIRRLISAGRRYIVIVNIHAGNEALLRGVVEDTYVAQGFPLLYFNPYTAYAQELNQVYFHERDNSFKECSLLLAGLEILGMKPIAEPTVDERAARDPLTEKLRRVGVLGFSYRTSAQHVGWRAEASARAGRKYLEETAERFIPVAEMFKEYVERELSCQGQTGQ